MRPSPRVLLTTLLLSSSALACGSDNGPTEPGMPSDVEVATYVVTFESTWNAFSHPSEFPPGPHFSGLIGATHDSGVTFWSDGGSASPGIQTMAETGGKSLLTAEVTAAIAAGTADRLLSGGGIGRSPGSVELTFEAHRDQPLVTLVSMIAPSPDWFVGVHDLPLRAGQSWRDEITIELFAYDAGTDSGPSYTSTNEVTQPAQSIARIQSGPLSSSVPLGTFVFQRVAG